MHHEDPLLARPSAPSPPLSRSMMPAREKGEFYKKDRKVLRFFCKYKDSRLQGDKRDYILYYYLLNDTVEIKEARTAVVFCIISLCVYCLYPRPNPENEKILIPRRSV